VKKVRKFILYTFGTLLVLILLVTALGFIYQDKIINLIVSEINKDLNTKVEVKKIELSLFRHFPEVTIVFNDVVVDESFKPSTGPLLTADKIHLTFNLFDILRENYTVKKIYLSNGSLALTHDKQGNGNYQVFREGTREKGNSSLKLNLEKISAENFEFIFQDLRNEQVYSGIAPFIEASLTFSDDVTRVNYQGSIDISQATIKETKYLENKLASVNGIIEYNGLKNFLTISPSKLKLQDADFAYQGNYDLTLSKIDFTVDAETPQISNLLSVLPAQFTGVLSEYQSEGEVYLRMKLSGVISNNRTPFINIDFGCKNASFHHPQFKKTFSNATITGNFTNGKNKSLSSSKLSLTNFEGEIDGKKLSGNLSLTDFTDPFLDLQIQGDAEINNLLSFAPQPYLESASGELNLSLEISGKIADLKAFSTASKVSTSGEVVFKDLNFKLKENALPFSDFNGHFIFNNNDIAINNFNGNVGESDFQVNGIFRNFLPYVFSDGQPIGIDASLKSKRMNLDQLLEDQKDSKNDAGYKFAISPLLLVRLQCDMENVKFRRFHGTHFKSVLYVKEQSAEFQQVQVNLASGKITGQGKIDAKDSEKIRVSSLSAYDKIRIDSVFYIFEDFGQDFISYKNLKGNLKANVECYFNMNSALEVDYPSILADISGTATSGELNNFEPLKRLSIFVDEKALANLKFSELKNNIHIEKSKIFIPEMEIVSNVSAISVMGTHTFSQQMDYKLKVPLRNVKKKDKDAAFGAIEDDGSGRSTLYLNLKGTTDDYKISYDVVAVKKKLKDDWQKEKQEFKNIFKKQPVDKKVAEKVLNEGEFFDFDSDN
jgi:uncharacterized protein involved in outer membrane biogenesis